MEEHACAYTSLLIPHILKFPETSPIGLDFQCKAGQFFGVIQKANKLACNISVMLLLYLEKAREESITRVIPANDSRIQLAAIDNADGSCSTFMAGK